MADVNFVADSEKRARISLIKQSETQVNKHVSSGETLYNQVARQLKWIYLLFACLQGTLSRLRLGDATRLDGECNGKSNIEWVNESCFGASCGGAKLSRGRVGQNCWPHRINIQWMAMDPRINFVVSSSSVCWCNFESKPQDGKSLTPSFIQAIFLPLRIMYFMT